MVDLVKPKISIKVIGMLFKKCVKINLLTMFFCICWLRVSYSKFFKQSNSIFFFVISKCHIAIGFISLSIGIIKYLLCKSINVSFTDLSFFAELKSTALLLWYLVPFQMNFLNLLLFMISRSPVKICTWSLSMKGDLAQSDGGNYRLEITESKVNILERIGFLRV